MTSSDRVRFCGCGWTELARQANEDLRRSKDQELANKDAQIADLKQKMEDMAIEFGDMLKDTLVRLPSPYTVSMPNFFWGGRDAVLICLAQSCGRGCVTGRRATLTRAAHAQDKMSEKIEATSSEWDKDTGVDVQKKLDDFNIGSMGT